MKYIPCILLFLLLLPPLWLLIRQRIAYHKTKAMPPGQKLALLKELLSPFGYCYLPIQDAISTTNDAWQKEAGYTTLYDRNVQRSQSADHPNHPDLPQPFHGTDLLPGSFTEQSPQRMLPCPRKPCSYPIRGDLRPVIREKPSAVIPASCFDCTGTKPDELRTVQPAYQTLYRYYG